MRRLFINKRKKNEARMYLYFYEKWMGLYEIANSKDIRDEVLDNACECLQKAYAEVGVNSMDELKRIIEK